MYRLDQKIEKHKKILGLVKFLTLEKIEIILVRCRYARGELELVLDDRPKSHPNAGEGRGKRRCFCSDPNKKPKK